MLALAEGLLIAEYGATATLIPAMVKEPPSESIVTSSGLELKQFGLT